MLEPGVIVSRETVRRWCAKFGQAYANDCAAGSPGSGQVAPGRGLHQDQRRAEYLWRAADGTVLDILVQNRRDTAAARRFSRKRLKKTRTVPRLIVTDKFRSYGAAHRAVVLFVEHRSYKGLNNRAENGPCPKAGWSAF